MSVPVKLIGGHGGNQKQAIITPDGSLLVSPSGPHLPDVGKPSIFRYYNVLMGSDGADSGTTNMNVDGSITTQNFYIRSNTEYDIRIMAIIIIIADTAVVHNKFGNVDALTNGFNLSMWEAGEGSYIIDAAKTGGQVIAQTGFAHAYGADASSFELTNWTGTQDAQTIVVPLHHILPGGVRIGRGTTDTLRAQVQDDLTGLNEFTVRILGYRHYPA